MAQMAPRAMPLAQRRSAATVARFAHLSLPVRQASDGQDPRPLPGRVLLVPARRVAGPERPPSPGRDRSNLLAARLLERLPCGTFGSGGVPRAGAAESQCRSVRRDRGAAI